MDVSIHHLNAWYGMTQVVHDVTVDIAPLRVTAAIGPSGAGKSTFVRCLNRMHETVVGARVSGEVLVGGVNIYAAGIEAIHVRRRIGMVFQQPNPLPQRSIYENVAIGARLNRNVRGRDMDMLVERCLTQAALWSETKDRLHQAAGQLSGGQQQRLCIARALAVDPSVLLMDEPCSALDPVATLQIEQLIDALKRSYTVIIVTHNMQQAARVADDTIFLLSGRIVEAGTTELLFSHPSRKETEDYVTGRFG